MKHLVSALALTLATAAAAPQAETPPDINVTSTDVAFSPNSIKIEIGKHASDNTVFETKTSLLGHHYSKVRACYDAHHIKLMLDAKTPEAQEAVRAEFVASAKEEIDQLLDHHQVTVNIDNSRGDVFAEGLPERLADAAAKVYADQIAKSMSAAALTLCH